MSSAPNAVVTREEAGQSITLTPMDMLDRAVAQGANVEVLEKLMSLQERWEKNQARKAFDNAMAEAKAEIPVILKNRQVGFDSKKAGAARTDYKHEDLAEIARTVDPILASHGLSYRFRTSSVPNEPITVTCIISHRGGHSEENSLQCPRDDTGNKNSIQQIGSTLTYLQRYSLKAALGLSASSDDDGKAAGDASTISVEQVETLRAAIVETGADLPRFLGWAAIEKLEELPAAKFEPAKRLLMQKAAAAKGSPA